MKAYLFRAAAVAALLVPGWMASAQAEILKSTIADCGGCGDCGSCDCNCCEDSCCDSCDDCCCDGPYLYTSLNLRGSFDRLESGGFNTIGPHPNTGSDTGETFSIGGALGVAIPRDLGTLRLEVEGIYVDPFNTVTDSFAPPTPTFFYQTSFEDRWAVMANSWFDLPLNACWDVYAGGGLGASGATMFVDDTVVQGSGSSTDFAYQVGGGLTRHFRRASVDIGYRYMDWGTSRVELEFLGGPAGDFTADVTSHQIFLGVRYNSLGRLFAR